MFAQRGRIIVSLRYTHKKKNTDVSANIVASMYTHMPQTSLVIHESLIPQISCYTDYVLCFDNASSLFHMQ